jgi:hypothetical protein
VGAGVPNARYTEHLVLVSLQLSDYGGVGSVDLAGTVPDPAPDMPATLRLEEISRARNNGVNPDHRTSMRLNSVELLDQTSDGKMRRVFTATVPAGLLASGTNTATVTALRPPGIVADDVWVNYWELDNARVFRAAQGYLDFRASGPAGHEYQSAGWASSQLEARDIADSSQPRRLTGLQFHYYYQLLEVEQSGAINHFGPIATQASWLDWPLATGLAVLMVLAAL